MDCSNGSKGNSNTLQNNNNDSKQAPGYNSNFNTLQTRHSCVINYKLCMQSASAKAKLYWCACYSDSVFVAVCVCVCLCFGWHLVRSLTEMVGSNIAIDRAKSSTQRQVQQLLLRRQQPSATSRTTMATCATCN